MKKAIVYILFISASFAVKGQQLLISTTGTIDFSNGFTSLNEAGTDFMSPINSNGNFYLAVSYQTWWQSYTQPDKQWAVSISKSDAWSSDLKLEVRRSGNGTIQMGFFSNRQPPSNGQSFQEITNSGLYFFEGQHGIADIPLEFRLVGASVTMGAGDYNSTIYFTVYDR